MTKIRVGGACKMLDADGQLVPSANLIATTLRKLTSLSPRERNAWLWALVDHNLTAIDNQVRIAAKWPKGRRMWRMGSEIVPAFTHKVTNNFYTSTEVMSEVSKRLMATGERARQARLRLSFHPGQFVVSRP
jgi:UV DNA damage repair endonuclease